MLPTTRFAVASASIMLCAAVATASPLNLVPGRPDASSGFIAVTYNATSHLFLATGASQNITLADNSLTNLNNREFTLSCYINNDGTVDGSQPASLVLRGDFGGLNALLFQSNVLSAFGSSPTNNFEFVFLATGGSQAALGTQIGTILIGNGLSFPGNNPVFTSSFSNEIIPGFGSGNADTFVIIPSPSAAVLAGLGLGLVGGLRRRR